MVNYMAKDKRSTFQKLRDTTSYKVGMGASNALMGIEALRYLFGMKKGGRVGCGVAKRGFGKAMKRKR